MFNKTMTPIYTPSTIPSIQRTVFFSVLIGGYFNLANKNIKYYVTNLTFIITFAPFKHQKLMSTIILGIESSCDDTSAAVIKDGYLLSNVVSSQAVHESYGG